MSGYIDEDECTGNECDGHTAECVAGAEGEGNTCMIKFDLVMPPPVTTVTPGTGTGTGATTLPSTPGGNSTGVTTVPATVPVPAGGDGDGSIIKETNITTGPSEEKPVPTAAPTSSGNVARVSIFLLVASAAVFGYLF